MARSGVYVDISSCTFTYAGPTVVTLREIADIQVDKKGNPIFHGADASPGPTIKKLTDQRREVTIIGADITLLESIPESAEGTLVWIENDMKNGTSTGKRTCTLVNCSIDEHSWGGEHNTVKKGTLKMSAVWTYSAGTYTDPYSEAEAA